MTKQLKPHFPPNSANKAYYADVNFDILGKIIEKVTDSRLEDIYNQFIYEPLGLKNTYLPQEENDFVPDIYYKQTRLQRPLFINSCPASGGGVSTARELMVFMKAFFSGQLFSHIHFKKHSLSNHLQMSMYPIQYGGGYMRIPLEGFSTLFTGKGELVGHTGSTGSFAFYYPHKELFLVGGVNQLANPTIPIRTAIKLAIALK
ncbi:serine hydrolase [Bacillus sp. JCM 19034]|uniref:serine hydrolase domain-containing protein n=1 Tax=Bacillus sp. JCM 19034 TaxID=1481928 RepID=UPI000783F258|nr:serine hydrolase domain-containing protein [Bacillus sp. JCM 19034]